MKNRFTSDQHKATKNLPAVSFTAAIVSDLHCHARTKGQGKESFLVVGDPRTPSGRHPVQSLLDLVQSAVLRTDVLLCPGDVTNKACPSGLSQGVQYLLELERELHCASLICTLGNHDVDSKKKHSQDPFDLSRNVHPKFPLEKKNPYITQYWADGFSVIECGSQAVIVVLNTVADHTDETTAKRGSFADHRLDALDQALESRVANWSAQLRMAVLHHHPLLHSHINYGSNDVLANGDQLLEVLAKHRIDVVVHGHKHEPRIRRQNLHGHNMILLAAGSFSAFLQDLGSTTRNLFHILELTRSVGQNDFLAILQTWEYNHGEGWNPAARKSAGLPHTVTFSGAIRNVNPWTIRDYVLSRVPPQIYANELINAFPDLEYLLPEEIEALGKEMASKYNLKFVYDESGSLYEIGILQRRE